MADTPNTQVMPQGAPPSAAMPGFGLPTSRVEGRQKVTGAARYASDFPGQAHAYLVTSPIARGRITGIEEAETRRVPGVLDILTYRNVGNRVKPGKVFEQQGYMGTTIAPLASDQVQHDGQIMALVVADTFEAAREGAYRLQVSYAEEAPSAGFDSPGTTVQTIEEAQSSSREGDEGGEERPKVGNAAAALAAAPVKVDVRYETPIQHHNTLELLVTTAAWDGQRLTVWSRPRTSTAFRTASPSSWAWTRPTCGSSRRWPAAASARADR